MKLNAASTETIMSTVFFTDKNEVFYYNDKHNFVKVIIENNGKGQGKS